jgi:F0F1-type ATP synthase delta subunit
MLNEQRYNEILQNINKYLNRFKSNPNSEENVRYYFTNVEQDAEKLYNLLNDGVYEIKIFELVKDVFKNIVEVMKENQKCNHLYIINELYLIVKYVYENILFIVENEFK